MEYSGICIPDGSGGVESFAAATVAIWPRPGRARRAWIATDSGLGSAPSLIGADARS
jgi:hypothetical protein